MLSLVLSLTVLLPTQNENKNTVFGVNRLVDSDWSAEETITKSISVPLRPRRGKNARTSYKYVEQTLKQIKILSFRRGEELDAGTAWCLTAQTPEQAEDRVHPPEYEAWRGKYRLGVDGDDNQILIIHLALLRHYTSASSNAGVSWQLDDKWEPIGFDLEAPLEDSTLPDRVVASAREPFYVDAQGDRVRKNAAPDGLLETITGVTSEVTPWRGGFIEQGESITLTPNGRASASWRIDEFKPPGYTKRPSASRR